MPSKYGSRKNRRKPQQRDKNFKEFAPRKGGDSHFPPQNKGPPQRKHLQAKEKSPLFVTRKGRASQPFDEEKRSREGGGRVWGRARGPIGYRGERDSDASRKGKVTKSPRSEEKGGWVQGGGTVGEKFQRARKVGKLWKSKLIAAERDGRS